VIHLISAYFGQKSHAQMSEPKQADFISAYFGQISHAKMSMPEQADLISAYFSPSPSCTVYAMNARKNKRSCMTKITLQRMLLVTQFSALKLR
jgi:hypothetical protein